MNDDDLFAAFASDSEPFSDGDDEDPFASLGSFDDDPFESLGAPEEKSFDAEPKDIPEVHTSPTIVSSPTTTPSGGARPEWLRELSGFDEEFDDKPARAKSRKKSAPREKQSSSVLSGMVGSGPQGVGFGMTAQQRMVLSMFLFLDTAVIGVLILMYIGAINVF
ncbi:MAG: hypothetical protein JXJ17_03815 [Anaerolineae bacterium]|nr:hypothetical protein [Anaerolineae bacterium]